MLPESVESSHCTVGAGTPEAVASKTAFWPGSAVVLAGCLVTAGAFCTVSVAASLVALPATFLNTARYCWPLLEVLVFATVSWFEVAPLTLVHVVPPFAEVCHCTVGVGEPEAVASKTALCPSSTVTLAGCFVTTGAARTVSVAALLVAWPAEFLKTARIWDPLSEVFVLAIVSGLVVAPSMGLQVLPPLVETSHCRVGVGVPEAVDVNVAL